jgi:hypothetical protein
MYIYIYIFIYIFIYVGLLKSLGGSDAFNSNDSLLQSNEAQDIKRDIHGEDNFIDAQGEDSFIDAQGEDSFIDGPPHTVIKKDL